MARRTEFVAGLLLAVLVSAAPGVSDELDKQRQRLARASDVVDRAKITAKLGDALLDHMTRAFRNDHAEEGEKLLAEYRGAIQDAGRQLLASGRDARRSPGGFKHLEIHIRKGARRLEDLSHALPFDQVEAIDEAREELESLRQDLLAALMRVNSDPARKGPTKEQHR